MTYLSYQTNTCKRKVMSFFLFPLIGSFFITIPITASAPANNMDITSQEMSSDSAISVDSHCYVDHC